jgi:hypothetical protein
MPPKRIAATCHPGREAHLDGLCAVCWFDKRAAVIEADSKALVTAAAKKESRKALMTLHQKVEHIGGLYKEAQAILRENLPRYAELHMTAAEVAASNGDARPIEWAMQSIRGAKGERIAEPPAKDSGTAGGGVKIMIGIKMGAMPEATAEVVDAEEESLAKY